MDVNGNKINLPGIDFVKVYTAVNQYNGWIGEVSTEILGAEDLHLTGNDNDVPVFTTGVSLDKSSLTMSPGQTATLVATIMPTDATNPKVTWKSSNTSVLTVTNGVITALAEGVTTVSAITNDGYYIATCTVQVSRISTGTPETTTEKPAVSYSDGTLRLFYLDGYQCLLTDLTGKILRSFRVNGTAVNVPLSLPKGIYLLKAENASTYNTFKLLITSN